MLSYNMRPTLYELLEKDEGYRQFPYKDTRGNTTVGIGRNLESRGISRDEALYLLQNDVKAVVSELLHVYLWVNNLSDVRKIVLINMAFNMGVPELLQFRSMWNALEARNYELAAKEMLNSEWAKQVPNRAERLAHFMERDSMA